MKHDPKPTIRGMATALLLSLTMPFAAEEAAGDDIVVPDDFMDAVVAGQTVLALRYRFESVDQDGFSESADAPTLRTTLSYSTAPYKGFRAFLEVANVTAVGAESYNNAGAGSLNNGIRDRPVVADPELTEINQGYLELAVKKTTLRLGRQEVNLGNQRFVGAVGWRQHHQSFDAFGLRSRPAERFGLSYHYLHKVNRIFGDSRDMSSHLLNADFDLTERDRLSGYGYLLDYDEPSSLALSTLTYGLRLAGHRRVDGARVGYTVEAALQQDAGDNPGRIDAEYYHAELAAGSKRFTVTVGGEILSGSPEDGSFSTPLATLHKFNGWADKFLRTPTNGLVDFYTGVAGRAGKVNWKVVYHDFQPENSGDDYGTELDLQAVYKTDRGLLFGLKAAFYEAEAFATDTEKIMFWTAYRISRKGGP